MEFKEVLKAQGLTDEQVTAVTNAMTKEKIYTTSLENADERYSKLKQQKEDLDTTVKTANDTITELKKGNKDNEELQAKVKDYEGTIETLKKDSDSKIRNLTLDHAINSILSTNKAKHTDLLVSKFDRDKLTIKEDGTVEGLDTQLTSIKETYKDLFTPTVTGNEPGFKGGSAGEGGDNNTLATQISNAMRGIF